MRKIIIILLPILILSIQKITCEHDCISTQNGIYHSSVAQKVKCEHECYKDRNSKMNDGYCTTCRHNHEVRAPIIVKVTKEDLHRKLQSQEPLLFNISTNNGK